MSRLHLRQQLLAAVSAIRNDRDGDLGHFHHVLSNLHSQSNELLGVVVDCWRETSDNSMNTGQATQDIGTASELLRVVLGIESIAQKASIACLECIQEGFISGRSAIFCISEIRLSILSILSFLPTPTDQPKCSSGEDSNSTSYSSSLSSSSSSSPKPSTSLLQTSSDASSALNMVRNVTAYTCEVTLLCIQPFLQGNNDPATACLDLLPAAVNVLAVLKRRYPHISKSENHIIDSLLSVEWHPTSFLPLFNVMSEMYLYLKRRHLRELKIRILRAFKSVQHMKDDIPGILKVCLRFLEQSRDPSWAQVLRIIYSNVPNAEIETVDSLLETCVSQTPSVYQNLVDIMEDTAVHLCRCISKQDFEERLKTDTHVEYDGIPIITLQDIRLLLVLSRTKNSTQIDIALPSILAGYAEDSIDLIRCGRAFLTLLLAASFILQYDKAVLGEDLFRLAGWDEIQSLDSLLHEHVPPFPSSSSTVSSSSSSANPSSTVPSTTPTSLLKNVIAILRLSLSHSMRQTNQNARRYEDWIENSQQQSWTQLLRAVQVITCCLNMSCYPQIAQTVIDMICRCVATYNKISLKQDGRNRQDASSHMETISESTSSPHNTFRTDTSRKIVVDFGLTKLLAECFVAVFHDVSGCNLSLLSVAMRGIMASVENNDVVNATNSSSKMEILRRKRLLKDSTQSHASKSAEAVLTLLISTLCHRFPSMLAPLHAPLQNYFMMTSMLPESSLHKIILPFSHVCCFSDTIFGHLLNAYRKYLLSKDLDKKRFAIKALVQLLSFVPTPSQSSSSLDIMQTLLYSFSLNLSVRRTLYLEYFKRMYTQNINVPETSTGASTSSVLGEEEIAPSQNDPLSFPEAMLLMRVSSRLQNFTVKDENNENNDGCESTTFYTSIGTGPRDTFFSPMLCIDIFRRVDGGTGTMLNEDICNLMSLAWVLNLRLNREKSIKLVNNVASLLCSCEKELLYVNDRLSSSQSSNRGLFTNQNRKIGESVSMLSANICNRLDSFIDESDNESSFLLAAVRFIAVGMPMVPCSAPASPSSSFGLSSSSSSVSSSSFANCSNQSSLNAMQIVAQGDSVCAHIACCHEILSGLLRCFIFTIAEDENSLTPQQRATISDAIMVIQTLLNLVLGIAVTLSPEKYPLRGFSSLSEAVWSKLSDPLTTSGSSRQMHHLPLTIDAGCTLLKFATDRFASIDSSESHKDQIDQINASDMTTTEGDLDEEKLDAGTTKSQEDDQVLPQSENITPLSFRLASIAHSSYEIGQIARNFSNSSNASDYPSSASATAKTTTAAGLEASSVSNSHGLIRLLDNLDRAYKKIGSVDAEERLLQESIQSARALFELNHGIEPAKSRKRRNKSKNRNGLGKLRPNCDNESNIDDMESDEDVNGNDEEDENDDDILSTAYPENSDKRFGFVSNSSTSHLALGSMDFQNDIEGNSDDEKGNHLDKLLGHQSGVPLVYQAAALGLPAFMSDAMASVWKEESISRTWDLESLQGELALVSSWKKMKAIVKDSTRTAIIEMRNEILWAVADTLSAISSEDQKNQVNGIYTPLLSKVERFKMSRYWSDEMKKAVLDSLTPRTFKAYSDILTFLVGRSPSSLTLDVRSLQHAYSEEEESTALDLKKDTMQSLHHVLLYQMNLTHQNIVSTTLNLLMMYSELQGRLELCLDIIASMVLSEGTNQNGGDSATDDTKVERRLVDKEGDEAIFEKVGCQLDANDKSIEEIHELSEADDDSNNLRTQFKTKLPFTPSGSFSLRQNASDILLGEIIKILDNILKELSKSNAGISDSMLQATHLESSRSKQNHVGNCVDYLALCIFSLIGGLDSNPKPTTGLLTLLNDRRRGQIFSLATKFISLCIVDATKLLKMAALMRKKANGPANPISTEKHTEADPMYDDETEEDEMEETTMGGDDEGVINVGAAAKRDNAGINTRKVNKSNNKNTLPLTSSINEKETSPEGSPSLFLSSLLTSVHPMTISVARDWIITRTLGLKSISSNTKAKRKEKGETKSLPHAAADFSDKNAQTLAFKIEELEWRLLHLLQEVDKPYPLSRGNPQISGKVMEEEEDEDAEIHDDDEGPMHGRYPPQMLRVMRAVDEQGRALVLCLRRSLKDQKKEQSMNDKMRNGSKSKRSRDQQNDDSSGSSDDIDDSDMFGQRNDIKLSIRSQASLLRAAKVASRRGGRGKRLRSRNSVIDEWLGAENGGDAYADLEDFIVA